MTPIWTTHFQAPHPSQTNSGQGLPDPLFFWNNSSTDNKLSCEAIEDNSQFIWAVLGLEKSESLLQVVDQFERVYVGVRLVTKREQLPHAHTKRPLQEKNTPWVSGQRGMNYREASEGSAPWQNFSEQGKLSIKQRHYWLLNR